MPSSDPEKLQAFRHRTLTFYATPEVQAKLQTLPKKKKSEFICQRILSDSDSSDSETEDIEFLMDFFEKHKKYLQSKITPEEQPQFRTIAEKITHD